MRDVLLVEDSPTIRALLVGALERQGFRVITVESGGDVLDRARDVLPSAVIINKMLPGRDGHQVIVDLRNDPIVRATKVMMLTESHHRDDVVRSISEGADDYVTKPFDPDDVAVRVRALVRPIDGVV